MREIQAADTDNLYLSHEQLIDKMYDNISTAAKEELKYDMLTLCDKAFVVTAASDVTRGACKARLSAQNADRILTATL